MNFTAMCEHYIELSKGVHTVKARRRIWPPNIHVTLGTLTEGSPMAVVKTEEIDGLGRPSFLRFGMNLVMHGEDVIFGWCPTIDDVMGQDWEFIQR